MSESNYTHADGLVGNVSGNYFPGPWSGVGFVNFNNGSGGDYHLSASSPYLAARHLFSRSTQLAGTGSL